MDPFKHPPDSDQNLGKSLTDNVTIHRMNQIIGEWEQRGDRRADFLRCYRLMTGNMLLAIEKGEFHNGSWVGHLLHNFAGYYFTALAIYEQEPNQAPSVWSTAHQIAVQPRTLVMQNLLLGINAHINYDLVLTLYDVLAPEWDMLSEPERRQRYEDHRQVNEVIGRTIDAVQDSIVEPKAPLMDIVDKLLGPIDEWATSLLIRRWREEVWQNSQRMLKAQTEQEQETIRQEIEALTMRRARLII